MNATRTRGRRDSIIVGCAAAAVAVIAVAVYSALSGRIDLRGVDWGNVPSWLTLLVSIATLAGVWVAFVNLRVGRAHIRDEQTALARLLVIEGKESQYSHGPNVNYARVIVTLRNASTTTAFTNIQVRGVTLDGLGCQQTFHDNWTEGSAPEFRFLGPNTTIHSGWVSPTPITTFDNEGRIEVQYEYTDGNGRCWRRLDTTEPQRVHTAGFDPARLQRFEDALNARPNDGSTLAPVDVTARVRSVFGDKPDGPTKD